MFLSCPKAGSGSWTAYNTWHTTTPGRSNYSERWQHAETIGSKTIHQLGVPSILANQHLLFENTDYHFRLLAVWIHIRWAARVFPSNKNSQGKVLTVANSPRNVNNIGKNSLSRNVLKGPRLARGVNLQVSQADESFRVGGYQCANSKLAFF